MPIVLSTYDEIVKRIEASMAANLPEVDPTIDGSFEKGFANSLGGRSFDIVQVIDQLIQELFPQTSTGEFLELWASYENITRDPATGSTGLVTFTGTLTTNIPVSTQIKSQSTGEIYTTDTAVTITNQLISVTSITRSGTVATVTTASDHLMSSGMSIDMLGAVETDYNGTFVITVTSLNTFTYTVAGSPTTPATGTITADYDGVSVAITATGTGITTNLSSGAKIDLITPIVGVDTSSLAQFNGIVGGADQQTDASLLVEVLSSRANPVTNFNPGAITKKAFEVPGVTRILVKRITPANGQVTILFVRDNDTNIIPDSSQVTTVKDKILEILPGTSDTADVIVTAPTPVSTDYTFSAISPDTATMRAAVGSKLQAYYTDEATFETDITTKKYEATIANTIDSTGATLASFTLTSPSADIVVTTDSIGILGSVIMP